MKKTQNQSGLLSAASACLGLESRVQNAAPIADLVSTTEARVAERPKEEPATPQMTKSERNAPTPNRCSRSSRPLDLESHLSQFPHRIGINAPCVDRVGIELSADRVVAAQLLEPFRMPP